MTAVDGEKTLLAQLQSLSEQAHAKMRKPQLGSPSVEEQMAYETLEGLLVPVIGAGISSRGSLPGNTLQRDERRRADGDRLRLQRLIEASFEGSPPQFTWRGPDARILCWAAAAEMLDNMCDTVYGPSSDTGGCAKNGDADQSPQPVLAPDQPLPSLDDLVSEETPDEGLRLLIHLQLHIARTLAAATRIWASGLRKQPRAFGPLFVDEGVPLILDSVVFPTELEAFWHAVLDSLNAGRKLADHCGWETPEAAELTPLTAVSCAREAPIKDVAGVLRPELIYVRLLQFVGETGTQNSEMWEYERPRYGKWYEEFRAKHLDVVGALQEDKHQTLMKKTGRKKPPLVTFRSEEGRGFLRRRHLEWLASLLRHTFVGPTQAYRNRAELAFAVSLDIPPSRQSRMPLRAWDLRETEMAWPLSPYHKERFSLTIKNTLDRSCRTETGIREPSRFIGALAQLVHWSAQNASAARGVESGLVLTTALDLEMETALSKLGPHRVLVPVWIKDLLRKDTVAGWLLASWGPASARHPYDPFRPQSWCLVNSGVQPALPIDHATSAGWKVLDSDDFQNALGPLVVKLEGSPMHDPRQWVANAAGPFVVEPQSDQHDELVQSRLPLGEADLFEFLQGALPKVQDELYTKLESSTLVFIGHDAFQWGDRAHHFGIRRARSAQGEFQDVARAFTAVSVRPGDGLAYADGVGTLASRMGVEPLGGSDEDASSLAIVAGKINGLAHHEGAT